MEYTDYIASKVNDAAGCGFDPGQLDSYEMFPHQSELAAERERREAAENLLLCYESQDFGAIAKHFARYKKEPTWK